ncbi:hypothetical protein [Arthrobacter sp. ERGS1:01]|uniref:hypothetical protein n=1 Tax=Arthrobacter sp. ERGS1:01 TaxID=1704044 RepID=UPI000AEB9F73|nr:hypothetical protein [Arthrobacter sp. ERGS1:01]
MKQTVGYTAKIFLNPPVLAAGFAAVPPEGRIAGKVAGAPAGTTVNATLDGVTTLAAVASNGEWWLAAPDTSGHFTLTAQAKNGFSSSASAKFRITVTEESPSAPEVENSAVESPALESSTPAGQSLPAGSDPESSDADRPGPIAAVTAAMRPALGAAAGLLLGGAAFVLFRRRPGA